MNRFNLTTSNEARLDDLLNRIAESLQLDQTRRDKMETAYRAVAKWIEEDIGFFKNVDFEIYPHGSVLAGTTVRPLNGEEFDLDVVLHLIIDWEIYDPALVFDKLVHRLRDNDTYKPMVELKNRVVKLNYSGDFHMDIMPGFQESPSDTDRILVRDKKLQGLVSSNPKGFAAWFTGKSETVKEFLLEKAYAMADLPEEEPYHMKKPLKRAVQLIKRYKNTYFENDPKNATASIILTTLAGQFYDGEGTIYDSVNNILARMESFARKGISDFRVFNPVNPDEEFTDKWHSEPILLERFLEFVVDFKEKWEALKREFNIEERIIELKSMFGETTISKAQLEQDNFFEKAFGIGLGSNIISSKPQYDEREGLRSLASQSKPYCKG